MHPHKRRISIFEIVVALIAMVLVGLIAMTLIGTTRFTEKSDMAKGVSNCRAILMALEKHISEHAFNPDDSMHREPNPPSANAAFRVLFQAGMIEDESIFGCPRSPYKPDGKIGVAPAFDEALGTGENHWMMTKGLSDSASGSIPLVYENAAVGEWNPAWNADIKGKSAPGRTWKRGIIIGMNDRSVILQKLASDKGSAVRAKELGGGKNVFTQHDSSDGETFEILDIER
jgi:hypothetical protein